MEEGPTKGKPTPDPPTKDARTGDVPAVEAPTAEAPTNGRIGGGPGEAPAGTLRHERLVAVPPEAAYAAFADPVRLARWWGPAGFRNEIHAFDLRPGGTWRLTMVGPDGARHPMQKRFRVVEPPHRVVVEHAQEGHTFTLDLRFEPSGAGTRLVWVAVFETPQQLEAVRAAFEQGNRDNLERLAQELARG